MSWMRRRSTRMTGTQKAMILIEVSYSYSSNLKVKDWRTNGLCKKENKYIYLFNVWLYSDDPPPREDDESVEDEEEDDEDDGNEQEEGVLLKIKLGCLNGNCYRLINYSRILYLIISRGRNVHCSRWKNCLSLGIAETMECALNWFITWLNQRQDLFEDDITLWHSKVWFYLRQYCIWNGFFRNVI